MGIDPVSLVVIGLVISGGAAAVSAIEQRKTRKSAEAQFKKKEDQTASQLEAARKAESDATAAAAKKVDERKKAIEAGGRPSTFAADAFGLRQDTDIRKKKLG